MTNETESLRVSLMPGTETPALCDVGPGGRALAKSD